ncbi:GTPase IMAP family member 9 [Brachionichthys hirsutus]|uniref:GTPase IMAP family member 9 n=1 Tax=Brachionichthys hirsutus TaxID=412623 RepID=UPI0036049AC9
MSASSAQTELRLVVLGRAEAGQSAAVCAILGLQDSDQGTESPLIADCSKRVGEAAGRKVAVVSSADWLNSDCDPNERRRRISSFIASSSPGPHAFLLAVAVDQPSDGEARALDVLAALFGPAALGTHTIILFTHTDELDEEETMEQYLLTWRKDLRELAGRCGFRYHTLETRGGEPERRKAVAGLLEKVELAVAAGGTPHFCCPLYQEAEERVRQRQAELVRRRGTASPSDSPQEENLTEEEMEAVREEAERSVDGLDVDVEAFFSPAGASPSSPAPSFLRGLWETLSAWTGWLPTVVRREALLGALVGLFVGGPFGGVIGASLGSVAVEVKRRRTQKTK